MSRIAFPKISSTALDDMKLFQVTKVKVLDTQRAKLELCIVFFYSTLTCLVGKPRKIVQLKTISIDAQKSRY